MSFQKDSQSKPKNSKGAFSELSLLEPELPILVDEVAKDFRNAGPLANSPASERTLCHIVFGTSARHRLVLPF